MQNFRVCRGVGGQKRHELTIANWVRVDGEQDYLEQETKQEIIDYHKLTATGEEDE